MMFQAYQHYFDQKGGDDARKSGINGANSSAANIQQVGAAARRGYRPMTGHVNSSSNPLNNNSRKPSKGVSG